MRMPATSDKKPRNKNSRLFARISLDDKNLIEKAAAIVGHSAATFVITQAREAASRLVETHETIRLNQAESRNLMQVLLAPPAPPTERMRRALKLYRETVISDVNPESPAVG